MTRYGDADRAESTPAQRTGTHAAARTARARSYLGPDSVYFRYLGDARGLLFGPRLLVLQTAHPAVGAAVREFSTYQQEPWNRLERTLRSLFTYVYGTERQALAEAARLMELHKPIKGVDAQGRRYSALNPEARLWVHATFYEPLITCGPLIYGPISDADRRRAFDEWRQIGCVLGLRDGDMPATVEEYWVYWQTMVDTRLEDNPAVQDVLRTLTDLPPPFGVSVPDLLWRPLWSTPGSLARLITVGTLPPELRDRFGLSWTPRQQRRLDRICATVRTGGRFVPVQMRYMPIAAKAVRTARRDRKRARRRAVVHHITHIARV